MSSVSKYVVFKSVTGGYVYRPPGSCVFGAGVHLLASESQKAAIIKAVDSVPLLPILAHLIRQRAPERLASVV
jgi:hypothetical protein